MEQRLIKWQTDLRISQLREGEGEWGEIRGTGENGEKCEDLGDQRQESLSGLTLPRSAD